MKRLIVLGLLAVIVPQAAMAAWWNPMSWGIFHRSDKATAVGQINTVRKAEKTPIPIKPSAKVEIRANGTKGWIKQTENVTISWNSTAKECNLTLEDEAFLVPGSGSKVFKLSFSGPYDTKHPTFFIGCLIDGKWVSDNVVVGGLLQ